MFPDNNFPVRSHLGPCDIISVLIICFLFAVKYLSCFMFFYKLYQMFFSLIPLRYFLFHVSLNASLPYNPQVLKT